MPFEFKPSEKKPQEYGGSPFKALMAEVKEFGSQRRKHNMRRYMGLEQDEAATSPMGDMEPQKEPMSPEECEACKAGTCDDLEHMDEEQKGKMLAILLPGGE
jgi:hypothetical protein